jgi:hypothetical protein
MADRVLPGPVERARPYGKRLRAYEENLRLLPDKDCAVDLRVYPLARFQPVIDGAASVRSLRRAALYHSGCGGGELQPGWFTVDIPSSTGSRASVLAAEYPP